MCSRFANVKDVRESIEWDTRVQECGGKIGFRTHNDGDDVRLGFRVEVRVGVRVKIRVRVRIRIRSRVSQVH